MKTIYTILLSVILSMFLNARAQVYMFQKTYGGTGTDRCYSTQTTSDGGFIMAGETDSYGGGNFDGYLIKTDEQGVIQWSKTYGDTAWDWLNSVRQTSDGGYIVTGGTGSYGTGYDDIWIIKTDASGNITWQKTVGGADYDNSYDVRQTTDNGYIVCGIIYSSTDFTDDACLIKLDGAGTVQWTKTYSLGFDEYAYTVEQTADGGYIVGGESYQSPGDSALIIKTDAGGNVQWAKSYGSNDGWISRIIKDASGNYFIAGTISQPSYLNIWLAQLDSTGTPLWSNSYAGAGALEDNCIWAARTSDGGFAICGSTNSFTADYECFLLKTDSTGGPEWTKRYGGSNNDNSVQVVQTPDGGYVLGSNALSFGTAGASVYLIKTNSSGSSSCNEFIPAFITNTITIAVAAATVTTSSVANSGTSTVAAAAQTITENTLCLTVGTDEIEMDGNEIIIYPNPAKNKLAIGNLQLAIKGIEVFDMLGTKVYSEQPSTNNYQLTIDISVLTRGMYFVRVRTDNGDVIRKLIKE